MGINLGATNSYLAIMDLNDKSVRDVIRIPSVVAFAADGKCLIGEEAKSQSGINPENTVYATKHLIGRRFEDPVVRKAIKHLPFKVIRHRNGAAWVSARGQDYSPSQINAHILTKLKEIAKSHCGETVSIAGVAVPTYFDNYQRQAITEACQIAGINNVLLGNEPTAAALAFGISGIPKPQVIAVCDFGGGAFNISMLEIICGVYEILATKSDISCGGEEVDVLIQNHIIDEFKKSSGIDVSKDRVALQRVREAAEKAKIDLSSATQVDINLPSLATDGSGSKNCNLKLARDKLESFADDILKKTINTCEACLKDSGLSKKRIDEVILVGGMSKMPKFQELVNHFYEKVPKKIANPEKTNAIGATRLIAAKILAGRR